MPFCFTHYYGDLSSLGIHGGFDLIGTGIVSVIVEYRLHLLQLIGGVRIYAKFITLLFLTLEVKPTLSEERGFVTCQKK